MCIKRCISAFKNKPRSYKNLKKWVSVYKRDSRVFSLLNLSILFPSGSTREEKVVLESWDMFDLHEMKLKRSPGFEVKWGANVRRFIVLILWLQSKHQASLSATGKLTNFGSSRRALNEIINSSSVWVHVVLSLSLLTLEISASTFFVLSFCDNTLANHNRS